MPAKSKEQQRKSRMRPDDESAQKQARPGRPEDEVEIEPVSEREFGEMVDEEEDDIDDEIDRLYP